MRATFRTGPVGTGAFLLGHRGAAAGAHDVDAWLLLLFFPLVPLWRGRVTSATAAEGVTGDTVQLSLLARSRVPWRLVLRRVAAAVAVGGLTCFPFCLGAWTIGSPWAAPALKPLLGSILGAGLLAKLGIGIELGVLLAGAALPVLVLMYLDRRMPRLPLSSAFRPEAAR